MKRIYLNLKRFDISPDSGGVNRIASAKDWGAFIVKGTQDELAAYPASETAFTMFFPEAHLLSASGALSPKSPLSIGCQGVYREDTAVGGNFGAFTSNRPAAIAKELGCTQALIGHFEERKDKTGILSEAGVTDTAAVNRILNKELMCALARGIEVLYCIGESSEEQDRWQKVLGAQLDLGLEGVDKSKVVIAYEPIWSIGPGKTPAGRDYIQKIARFVKDRTGGMAVVYGGGLKVDNAQMLASIPEIDGGLIALTRFSGEIGFYPDEYLEIIKTYLGK